MIILASTSAYRRAILEQIGISFQAVAPNIDETPHDEENAMTLVSRLAREKASAVSANAQDFVIGSDQIATLDGELIGKPHTFERAKAQLEAFSNRSVTFYTALALKHQNTLHSTIETTTVSFRHLTTEIIEHYLHTEKPLNCAGAFKSEGLGILLFRAITGRDPNALIGLPLIALNELFDRYGVSLIFQAQSRL